QGDAARVARNEPHDHVERRRLARAVRAEEADHLALVHVEREPSDDLAGFVALFEADGRQCNHQGFAGAGGVASGLVRGWPAGAGVAPGFFDALGSMVMRTRSLPGMVIFVGSSLPVLRISALRMSYTSCGVLISLPPSLSQASCNRRTTPVFASYTIWRAWPRVIAPESARFCSN